MKFVRVLPALCLIMAEPALADEGSNTSTPPAATTGDADTLAAALALFDGQDVDGQLLASALHMAKASMEADMESLKAKGIDMPQSLTERLSALIYEETKLMVEQMAPTFRQDAAAIYARYFTAEELRELKRLQEHPVMKKMEGLAPSLMAELSKIGMRAAAERMPEIERKSQELVEQWLSDESMAEAGPNT